MKSTTTTNCCDKSLFCGHFWGPVFVGAVVGVGLNFLVSLLSVAFGFIAFSANSQTGDLSLSVSGFIGLIALTIACAFFIGWLTSYLGKPHCHYRYAGELFGITAWSLALILSVLLASNTGKFMSNYEYVVNKNYQPAQQTTQAMSNAVTAKIENHMSSDKTPLEKKADIAGTMAFVVFFMFFISALSSCLGGRTARHWRRTWCADPMSPRDL